MEPSIVSPEQLAQLQKINDTYLSLTQEYGVVKYEQLLLNAQLTDIESQMMELEVSRIQAIQLLQEQFGSAGTVDLETGAFIPENSQ